MILIWLWSECENFSYNVVNKQKKKNPVWVNCCLLEVVCPLATWYLTVLCLQWIQFLFLYYRSVVSVEWYVAWHRFKPTANTNGLQWPFICKLLLPNRGMFLWIINGCHTENQEIMLPTGWTLTTHRLWTATLGWTVVTKYFPHLQLVSMESVILKEIL